MREWVKIEGCAVIIEWSPLDDCFVATAPRFPGMSAFGATKAEVLAEARVALSLFLEADNDPT